MKVKWRQDNQKNQRDGRNSITVQNCFSNVKKTKVSLSKDESIALDDDVPIEEAVATQPLLCVEGPKWLDGRVNMDCKTEIAKSKERASMHHQFFWKLDNTKDMNLDDLCSGSPIKKTLNIVLDTALKLVYVFLECLPTLSSRKIAKQKTKNYGFYYCAWMAIIPWDMTKRVGQQLVNSNA